VSSKLEILGL